MGNFSETSRAIWLLEAYNDPRFPKVSAKSIQKSDVLQGVTIVQDMHNPVFPGQIVVETRSDLVT